MKDFTEFHLLKPNILRYTEFQPAFKRWRWDLDKDIILGGFHVESQRLVGSGLRTRATRAVVALMSTTI